MRYRELIIKREYTHLILLLDHSESMVWPYLSSMKFANQLESKEYQEGVKKFHKAIENAHNLALTSIRNSAVCLDGFLKVTQCLFSHHRTFINDDEPVSSSGDDSLSLLTERKNIPNGATALYDAVYESLQYVYTNKIKPAIEKEHRGDQIIIAVITDGQDTFCQRILQYDSPEKYLQKKVERIKQIRELMHQLKGHRRGGHNVLLSSVIIGLTNSITKFTEKQLIGIQEELYFDKYVNIDNEDEKSLREAFKLFSVNSAR